MAATEMIKYFCKNPKNSTDHFMIARVAHNRIANFEKDKYESIINSDIIKTQFLLYTLPDNQIFKKETQNTFIIIHYQQLILFRVAGGGANPSIPGRDIQPLPPTGTPSLSTIHLC